MFTSADLVFAAYQAILGREPDEEGFRLWMQEIETRKLSAYEFLKGIISSDEYQKKLYSFQDHSQYGEYRMILKQIVNEKSSHNVVVDVGARGKERSNSFDLMKNFGWKGLLIEANSRLCEDIEKSFYGLDFILVNCAVGLQTGTQKFYIGMNDDVSSLSQTFAEAWGNIRDQISIEVRKLSDILCEQQIPKDFDLLSVDIEGFDVQVFNDLIETTSFRPQYVIIETSHSFSNKTLEDAGFHHAVTSAYSLIAQTEANMILYAKIRN